MEELRERITKYFNSTPEIKAQLAFYTPEVLVSGAVVIQPMRAYEYERMYKAEFIPAPPAAPVVQQQQKGKKQQQQQQKPQQQTTPAQPQPSPTNEGIPPEHMLYVGVIVGLISESYLNIAPTAKAAGGSKVIVKKRKTLVKGSKAEEEALAAEAAAAEEAEKTANGGLGAGFDFNNIPLSCMGDVNSDAMLKLANMGSTPYRMSREELQQLERKKLTQLKNKSLLKKELWQAQRRIQHREEKGTKADRKDAYILKRTEHKLETIKERETQERDARKKQKAERDARRAAQKKDGGEEFVQLDQ